MTRKKIIGGIVLGVAVLSLVTALLVRAGSLDRAGTGEAGPAYRGTGGSVGIIEISGMITSGGTSAGLFGESVTGSQTVMAQLRQVSENPDIKAVVLRINSPGGTPAAAQEITGEILKLKGSGVKVVSSMGDVAASGAYWIASASDKIVSNPGTITGSIGVLMQTQNYQGLFEKLGINTHTFKSGDYKDMGSPDRPLTGEEMEIFQSMVDDTYIQFLEAVSGSRKIDPDALRRLSGRVLTGRQAVNEGLVDQLGNFYDAVGLAGEMAGLGPKPRTVNLSPRGQWWRLFEQIGSSGKMGDVLLNDLRFYPGVLLICPPVQTSVAGRRVPG